MGEIGIEIDVREIAAVAGANFPGEIVVTVDQRRVAENAVNARVDLGLGEMRGGWLGGGGTNKERRCCSDNQSTHFPHPSPDCAQRKSGVH